REVAGDHAELADGIERRALSHGSGEEVDVLAAVQQDVGGSRALSVDGEARAALRRIVAAHVAGGADQRVSVTRQGWQFGDLLAGYDLRELLVFGLYLYSALAHYFYSGLAAGESQRKVHRVARADGH